METNLKTKDIGILRILPCAKGYQVPTFLTPLFVILEVMLEVFIPMLMAALVDGGLYRADDFILKQYFPASLVANQKQFILVVGCIMILAALLSLTFGMLAARTAAVAGMGFAKNLRKCIFEKIQSFSFKNTDKFSTPSLVMRATTDVNNLQNLYQQAIRLFVRSPIMMILAAVMAMRINLNLSMIFMVAVPLLLGVLLAFGKISRPRFAVMLKKYDKMNASVQENLTAVRVVKAFVREEYEKEKFKNAADELQKTQVFAQKLFTYIGPIQMFIMWSCAIILLILGGKEVIFIGSLQKGELVSLLTYTNQVVSSLAMVGMIFMMLTMTRESIARINEVLDEEIDIVDPKGNLKVENGDIEFRNVDFSYTGNKENLTLHNINLTLKTGETIGIIGGTGEGKSTFVQLIPRFYDVMHGEVRLAGHNVKDYSLYELRESVSMVLQKNMLFSGTIRENLRWGNPNATDEQLIDACKLACAHDFIMRFPDAYDTDLGQGGVNVSGGQKQRLCIARALLKNPKVLILDDSTSAVDSKTDESIRRAFRENLKGTTKLIIAQRISSIQDSDRIIVLDKGTVSDIGTHEELMQRSVIYQEVYRSQNKAKMDVAGGTHNG